MILPGLCITAVLAFSLASAPAEYKANCIANGLDRFNRSVIALDRCAGEFQSGRTSVDSLRRSVLQTRQSFKEVEFFLAFHYPEFTAEHINGAPLLHIEREGTQPVVLEPEGLQVLDEKIFSETANEDKAVIAALAKKLLSHYGALHASLQNGQLQTGTRLEALRLELVRIFTLGVTGFDTPGSLNALPEAGCALRGMRTYFVEYSSAANKPQIEAMFKNAERFVRDSGSFDTFDRLAFLKDHIEPLYRELGKLGTAPTETLARTSAWNAKSSSIFSDEFLDPYYFTELKPSEDSPELRDLGKALFFDAAVSNDGKMSCASCHDPRKAFTDATAKSVSSLPGKTVLRNSPTLLNAVYADRFFYDLRAFTLEQQAEHVIFNPEEFNTAYASILKKLTADKKYAARFGKIFGKGAITRDMFSKALASYVLSLRSFNSPFDKYIRAEVNDIPQDAKNGFNLFTGKANCATCHFPPTFSGLVPPLYSENESEILGVLENPKAARPQIDPDEGRAGNAIHSEQAWIYGKSFKTTTVRNAARTAPYFHNGAYASLEEVIDFYNDGGGEGRGFPVPNQTLPADKLELTDKEKKELIAFIKTLDDASFDPVK